MVCNDVKWTDMHQDMVQNRSLANTVGLEAPPKTNLHMGTTVRILPLAISILFIHITITAQRNYT